MINRVVLRYSQAIQSFAASSELETEAYLVGEIIFARVDSLVPNSICPANKLVQFTVCVVLGQPGSLAIIGILATLILLFLSCIDDRNTICHDGERSNIFGESGVIGVTEKQRK